MKTTKLTSASLLLILSGFLTSCTGALTPPREPGDTEAPLIILTAGKTELLCGNSQFLTPEDGPGYVIFVSSVIAKVAASDDSQEDLDANIVLIVTDEDGNAIDPEESGGYIQTQGLMTFTWRVADASENVGTCSLSMVVPANTYTNPLTVNLYNAQPSVMCEDMDFLMPAVDPSTMEEVGTLFILPIRTELTRDDDTFANPQVVAELVVTDKDGNVIAPEDSGGYIQTPGLMTFTWTATDSNGNTGSCSLTMTVTPTVTP